MSTRSFHTHKTRVVGSHLAPYQRSLSRQNWWLLKFPSISSKPNGTKNIYISGIRCRAPSRNLLWRRVHHVRQVVQVVGTVKSSVLTNVLYLRSWVPLLVWFPIMTKPSTPYKIAPARCVSPSYSFSSSILVVDQQIGHSIRGAWDHPQHTIQSREYRVQCIIPISNTNESSHFTS